jgi:beta-mannanase
MRILNRLTGLLLCVFALKSGMAQTQLYSNSITATTAKLNWSFDLTPQQGIYYGAYDTDMSTFMTDAGKPVSVWHKYIAWGSSWNAFPSSTLTPIRNAGAVPLITWEPWAYSTTDANYTLANIINGNFDAYITTWATNAKSWGYPFFLRLAHEMNGKTWYPWQEGYNTNTSGQYVQAWKHVVDIFRAVGCNNANWVWCPNVSYYGSTSLATLYPGHDYVDWVALDGYNMATSTSNWKTFSTVFNATLGELAQIAPGKNIMVAETGSSEAGGSKAAWITDAISVQVAANPNIKAVLWFNHVDNYDFRIQSSAGATAAFSAAIANPYFLSNQFGSVGANVTYFVRYRVVGDTAWSSFTSTSNWYNATGLYPGTQYEYTIQVLSPLSQAPASQPAYFTTDPIVTSVGNQEMTADELSVFPNPSQAEFNIKLTSKEDAALDVNVYDARGKLVYSSDKHSTNEKFTVGEDFASGLYFIHIKKGKEEKVIKMVKTR